MNQNETNKITLAYKSEIIEFPFTSDHPIAVVETDVYSAWIDRIQDIRTNARITKDVNKMRRGLFGDWKEIDGIFEMRLDYGSGYRVYYARFDRIVIILLGGGTKGSQKSDIRAASALWKELQNEIKEI